MNECSETDIIRQINDYIVQIIKDNIKPNLNLGFYRLVYYDL